MRGFDGTPSCWVLMNLHSFLTFFLNSYHSFCRCILHLFELPGLAKDPLLPLLVANTEPCKAGRKSGWWSSGWVVGGAHLSHSASGSLSSILQYVYSPTFKKLWPDYSHLNHLERLCKIILWVEKKILFPVWCWDIHHVERHCASYCRRDVVTNSSPSEFISAPSKARSYSHLLIPWFKTCSFFSAPNGSIFKNHCCCVISTGHYGDLPGGSVAATHKLPL